MLSMEKLRFLAWGCEAAGGRMISEAASRRSVGVRGGEAREEKLEDMREDLGEEAGDTGESHTRMSGESLRRPSSVLIWAGWRMGK